MLTRGIAVTGVVIDLHEAKRVIETMPLKVGDPIQFGQIPAVLLMKMNTENVVMVIVLDSVLENLNMIEVVMMIEEDMMIEDMVMMREEVRVNMNLIEADTIEMFKTIADMMIPTREVLVILKVGVINVLTTDLAMEIKTRDLKIVVFLIHLIDVGLKSSHQITREIMISLALLQSVQ
jgi:hypothetical protein